MTSLYCILLRLYPAAFYDRFARDMLADLDDGCADARQRGRLTLIEFFMRSHADLLASVATQWRYTESFTIWRASVSIALTIWVLVFVIAAMEWPRGPVTPLFAVQLSLALTIGAALTIGLALHSTRAVTPTNPVSRSRNS